MTVTATRPPPPSGPVTATLNFSRHPPAGQQAKSYNGTPPEGEPQHNTEVDPHDVQINDIRGSETSFTLDHDGFKFLSPDAVSAAAAEFPEKKKNDAGGFSFDWDDDDAVKREYYPTVTRLLLSQIPDSTHVVIFDHTVRRSSPTADRRPVPYVHLDQTPLSAAKRVRTHLSDSALLQSSSPSSPSSSSSSSYPTADEIFANKTRYRIVNVWRPLNESPVESDPLAFCSGASLRDEDVIPIEHHYVDSGYTGQTAAIAFDGRQGWYYASGMTSRERLLIECFDSEMAILKKEGEGGEKKTTSPGVLGGRAPHTAFADPRTREGAEGRESVEVRALVFGP